MRIGRVADVIKHVYFLTRSLAWQWWIFQKLSWMAMFGNAVVLLGEKECECGETGMYYLRGHYLKREREKK